MGFSQPARLRIQNFKLWQGVVNYAHVAMFRVQDLEISEFVHVHKRVKVIVTIMITQNEPIPKVASPCRAPVQTTLLTSSRFL